MQCTSPVHIRNSVTGNMMTVPCGHCLHCRLQKTREWAVRLNNELNYHEDSCFQTLTYRDDCRPTLPCGKSYLVKSDLQKFIKRMRKYFDDKKLKYFACGEYGEESKKCHFHLIIFGLSVKEMNEALPKLWTYGDPYCCKTGTVTPYSIQYVTGYVRKKLDGKGKLKGYFWCLPSEFQLSSQGLGLQYAEDYKDNICSSGMRLQGNVVSVPRYYNKKVEEIANVLQKRANKSIFNYWLNYFNGDKAKAFKMMLKSDVKPDVESFESKEQRNKNIKARYDLYGRNKI